MKILFLTLAFPNVETNSNLYSDLANELVINNHDLLVVAPQKRGQRTQVQIEGNTKVLRVRTLPLFNIDPIRKGIANILLPFQYLKAIKKNAAERNFDLIISPTPPITLYRAIKRLKKQYSAKSYLILRDIFPQNAMDLGLIRNKFIFYLFRRQERKLYKISDYIGCMSAGNIEYVKEHNKEINADKLHILPNWIKVKPVKTQNDDIKNKYNLSEKFVAVFGGNVGIPQYVDFILDLASYYLSNLSIIFLIIGDGTEVNRIKTRIQNEGISNVVFKDMIPQEDYLKLIQQCDLGLVNLHPSFTIPNIPSRTLAYMQAKIPILAAIDRNTDLNDFIDKSSCGLWCYSDDLEDYKEKFEIMLNDKALRKNMGANGYNYLKANFDVNNIYKIILNEIK
jgi:glycosyltransferase involved in cell wall biosynthesis